MEAGNIGGWKIEEGSAFDAGDVLCEIETDKATVDFEAQDEGYLAKIIKPDGSQDIPVGSPVCIFVDDEDDVAKFVDYVHEEDTAAAAAVEEEVPSLDVNTSTAVATGDAPKRTVSDEYLLTPAARHLSQSKGLDATVLVGTGKGGRVTKGDVLMNLESLPSLSTKSVGASATSAAAALATPAAVAPSPSVTAIATSDLPQPAGTYEDIPNNNMRKVIAKRLTESKRDVPHFYTSVEVELDEVLALRKKLAKNNVKVSVNDLIIKSSALALRDVQQVNSTYNAKSGKVSVSSTVDISVAVATPTGLITPIVTEADKRGLSNISDCVKDLATRARDGKLKPEEYQGGTFTISNLGMFGIDEFSAVINPPQAAILAVGGGKPKIIPTPYVDGVEEQEKPQVKTIMTAKLSADRRVVDEATAAVFMNAFQQYLGQPHLL
eukprot:CAMPEP_0116058626 /NCGR_PEP_ID=MMETSP0322-20121206/5307_1 /TAXON_ID=163516 /ORGANISM="Leptocylindrus danicus var. apora, Strain B651" /LENGTH=435 /DNA_ID=CAMNT_0003542841 /DNA_START=203 /DNA_END=1507 /DNA_ORIENTATION=+